MSNISTFAFDGNIVRDAELTYVGTKKTALCKFSVAVNTGYGEYKKANFFDCEMWGRPAEALSQYMTKGKSVTCSGEISQDRWEGDSGKRSKIKFKVEKISMHGGNEKAASSEGYQPPDDGASSFDDDIPF